MLAALWWAARVLRWSESSRWSRRVTEPTLSLATHGTMPGIAGALAAPIVMVATAALRSRNYFSWDYDHCGADSDNE